MEEVDPELKHFTEEEKAKFYALFAELEKSSDPKQRARIKEELAQLIYGC